MTPEDRLRSTLDRLIPLLTYLRDSVAGTTLENEAARIDEADRLTTEMYEIVGVKDTSARP